MNRLPQKDVRKVQTVLDLFSTAEQMPRHYISFVREGIYELRITSSRVEIRIFFVYDGEDIVVLFTCFKKKTQKTPEADIQKAIKLKEDYYAAKGNQQGHL